MKSYILNGNILFFLINHQSFKQTNYLEQRYPTFKFYITPDNEMFRNPSHVELYSLFNIACCGFQIFVGALQDYLRNTCGPGAVVGNH